MRKALFFTIGVVSVISFWPQRSMAEGEASKGAELFRHCAACHSLEPNRHLTGPSLANVWGRKAGTAPGFTRYSEALKKADVTWDAKTLDAFLKNPQAFIPGNQMPFPGIENSEAREDMIAYLKTAGSIANRPQGGGMMGHMTGGAKLDLKDTVPKQEVAAIRYCGDAYFVTLGTGATFTFWEFNLRFKTDSSQDGPPKGKPTIVRAGMMGDRAFIVFADPEEMSAFIKRRC